MEGNRVGCDSSTAAVPIGVGRSFCSPQADGRSRQT
jgi:hypothetical protein